MRVDAKSEVAQDLGAQPVAQSHVLESDHPPSPESFSKGPGESDSPGPVKHRKKLPPRLFAGLIHPKSHFLQHYRATASVWKRSAAGKSTFGVGRHGFRSINGRLLGLPHRIPSKPCLSPVRIAPPLTQSTRPRWARPAERFAARAARPRGSPPGASPKWRTSRRAP